MGWGVGTKPRRWDLERTGHHQEMRPKEREWNQLEGKEGRRLALSARWWFLGWEELGMLMGRGKGGLVFFHRVDPWG